MKVVSSIGLKAALDALPHGATAEFRTAVPIKRDIDAGMRFDVAILTPVMLEDLAARGIVLPDSVTLVAKSFMGLGVRTGASRPDISSTEALKRTLRQAKSIAYSKEGQSGMFMAGLIERLGLAAELAPKTVLETRPGGTAFNLAEGRAELAFTIASEIVPIPGAELAALLPPELAHGVRFAAGISPAADRKAAQAFLDLLKSPAAASAFKASGLEFP